MRKWKQISLLSVLVWVLSSTATAAVSLKGKLLEKGTRAPLSEANIFILPSKLRGVTDAKGEFTIVDVPEGDITWVVNRAGYLKFEMAGKIDAESADTEFTIYLEKDSYQVYETVIVDKSRRKDDSAKTLTAAQFATLPGSGGDPIKAVQNLPGVNRTSAFRSQIIIQGSAPQDTKYHLDGHEVPLIFHFGGLTSVIAPESVERVDYLSAGYGPEYGRAMGGLVGAWTRKPKADRLHGMAFVDIFNAGAYAEGPAGEKSSYFFGFRKSYVGEVLRKVFKKNDDFNLTVAPSFSDMTGVYDAEITPRDSFRLLTVGSIDTLEFVLKQPVKQDPSLRGNFYNETSFFRLIPQLTHRHSTVTVSRWSVGFGRDFIRFDNGENYFNLKTYALTARGEVERKMTESWTSALGFDNRYSWAEVRLRLPSSFSAGGVSNPFSSGEIQSATVEATNHQVGAYWTNQIQVPGSRWSFVPSSRIDYFKTTKEFLPAPRIAASYQLDPTLKIKSAGGLYYQAPREQETAEKVGNPDLKSPSAWHAALGAEKDLKGDSTEGGVLSGGFFYRAFDKLVEQSSRIKTVGGQLVPERYNNDGDGKAYGFESQYKFDFNPWSGWFTYTFLKSLRSSPGVDEHPSQYDQTHSISAIVSRDLPKNWKISGRARYVTGNPTTPVTGGIFDADNDVYIPVRGPYYSERLDPFFQIDLRFDKKWIFRDWILTLYLDIQNVTNQKNSEAIEYSYDYSKKQNVNGLPILPTFGLKGEF